MNKLMRPYDFDIKHLVLPCYISPKLDGVRAHDDEGMFFRSGKPIFGVDHIYNAIKDLPMRLDGEMLIPGLPFQESAGLIRNYDATPNAELYVFDYYNTPDSFLNRVGNLKLIKVLSDKVHIITHTQVNTLEELYRYHNNYVTLGLEGSVIKTAHHTYQFKKSWDWMRLVPVHSIDVVPYDMYEGKGKYVGMMGGVQCRGEGVEVKVGTGFNDDERMKYWLNPPLIIGKTIRVTYKEKTKDGSLRHPSFDRIRQDK